MEQVRVVLQATDPLSLAGLMSYLEPSVEMTVLRTEQRADADVLVVAADTLTADIVNMLRRSAAEVGPPVVLVANEITKDQLLTVVACRVAAFLPKDAATGEQLVRSIKAAASGGGRMPANLVGELLKHVERLQREMLSPVGLNASGLKPREVAVLRLMADGMNTTEIAEQLGFSERTIKYILKQVMDRLNLRNRQHAVAYALRAGVI